jgi:hypothetical protein
VTATPLGPCPPSIVATTVSVSVSITDILLLSKLVIYAYCPIWKLDCCTVTVIEAVFELVPFALLAVRLTV